MKRRQRLGSRTVHGIRLQVAAHWRGPRWDGLDDDAKAAEAAELRQVADGRTDLLAEAAGLALGMGEIRGPEYEVRGTPWPNCAAWPAPTRA